MTAPERWLGSDSAPEGAEALLRSATVPEIPPDVHARLVGYTAKLAVAPSLGIATLVTSKVAAGAAAVGAAGLVGAVVLQPIVDPPVRAQAAPIVVRLDPKPSRTVAVPSHQVAPTLDVSALPVEAPPKRARRPVVDPLAQETDLLESARRALSSGDASRALSLAREHERRFPEGQLRASARVIATRALARLDRSDEAKQEASRLLEREPAGLHAPEAERVLSDPER